MPLGYLVKHAIQQLASPVAQARRQLNTATQSIVASQLAT
jgi:hypothetical protein